MDQEKPFKTIEVVDSRTSQVCKIACMSCIRGHRTTSCGIPVCRQKIFWTVKRPGRPSNSCNCRYGSTGGCKCVTAMSKCPHKAKKGEKRSSECRCDEQGRYCCLLEPDHWDALAQLQKPTVDFYPNRDALEAGHIAPTPMTIASTPSYFSPATPQRNGSCCGTPAPQYTQSQPMHSVPSPHPGMMSPQTADLTPRFGFMGIGGPMGDLGHQSADVMGWNGPSPVAPNSLNHRPIYEQPQIEEQSCCSSSTPAIYNEPIVEDGGCCQESVPAVSDQDAFSFGDPLSQSLDTFQPPASQEPFDTRYTQPAFDFDRWAQTYQAYQYPNAICQKCGLNGCTCRNCPPVMQNYGTSSWAQCCGRKHARMNPAPPPRQPQAQFRMPQPQSQPQPPQVTMPPHTNTSVQQHPAQLPIGQYTHSATQPPMDFDFELPPDMDMDLLSSLHASGTNGFDQNFDMNQAQDTVSYSDFLMTQLDRPSHATGENGFAS